MISGHDMFLLIAIGVMLLLLLLGVVCVFGLMDSLLGNALSKKLKKLMDE